jgi:hypothetical protein
VTQIPVPGGWQHIYYNRWNQSFTLRLQKGHGSANATTSNTNASDHTTIAKASTASSEYHTMEALGRALVTQARLGVGQ